MRRQAFTLHEQGLSNVRISKALVRSVCTVQGWLAKSHDRDIEVLAAKPHAGAKPKPGVRQRRALRQQLSQGTRAHGYDTVRRTAARGQELTGRRYGVEYHVNYVPDLLRTLGSSRQK